MSTSNKHHSKHRNQVRIIAGIHKGRKITFMDKEGLRPTPDSVREKLFNWLGQDLTGKKILDLFAGSGALGFESLSRYAQKVDMCELQRENTQQLKNIAKTLGVAEKITIYQQDALNFLNNTSEQYHIIFLDPPFAWNHWSELFSALKKHLYPQAYVYIEAGQLPDIPEWLEIYRQGKAGQSHFLLLTTSASP